MQLFMVIDLLTQLQVLPLHINCLQGRNSYLSLSFSVSKGEKYFPGSPTKLFFISLAHISHTLAFKLIDGTGQRDYGSNSLSTVSLTYPWSSAV